MPALRDHLAALAAAPLALWGPACILNTSCVAAGTPIATPLGWIPIESLRPGDPIYAVDLAAGRLVATVVASTRRAERECLALHALGRDLLLTPDHPVYAPELAGYVDAGRVALGQITQLLVVADPRPGARPEVVPAGPPRLDVGVRPVFDLGVACEHHNFIAAGVVVHNKSPDCEATPSFCSGTTDAATDTGSSSGSTAATTTTAATATATTAESTTAETTTDETTDADPVHFPCGETICLIATEYCVLEASSCAPIPDVCLVDRTCECLLANTSAPTCNLSPEGGLVTNLP